MIAFVSGPVAALAPDSAVVEVGGIGIAVQCAPNTLVRPARWHSRPDSPPPWSSARTP